MSNWTKDKPTQNGWYFWRQSANTDVSSYWGGYIKDRKTGLIDFPVEGVVGGEWFFISDKLEEDTV